MVKGCHACQTRPLGAVWGLRIMPKDTLTWSAEAEIEPTADGWSAATPPGCCRHDRFILTYPEVPGFKVVVRHLVGVLQLAKEEGQDVLHLLVVDLSQHTPFLLGAKQEST